MRIAICDDDTDFLLKEKEVIKNKYKNINKKCNQKNN